MESWRARVHATLLVAVRRLAVEQLFSVRSLQKRQRKNEWVAMKSYREVCGSYRPRTLLLRRRLGSSWACSMTLFTGADASSKSVNGKICKKDPASAQGWGCSPIKEPR